MALDRGPTHPLLDRRKIINCNHPTEPTTTLSRSRPDRLTKRRLVSRRMIQNTDHLEILPARQRQDPVAGAEPRMESAVEKRHPQLRSESLCRASRPSGPAANDRSMRPTLLPGAISEEQVLSPAEPGQLAGRIGRMTHRYRAGTRISTSRRGLRTRLRPSARPARRGFSAYTGRTPWCASVLDEQYQSRSATGTPTVATVLANGDLGVGRVVGAGHRTELAADRQLPADVGLGFQEFAALAQGEQVQRAALTGRKAWTVEKDAGTVDHPRLALQAHPRQDDQDVPPRPIRRRGRLFVLPLAGLELGPPCRRVSSSAASANAEVQQPSCGRSA